MSYKSRLVFVVVLTVSATALRAQDCGDYSQLSTIIGSVELPTEGERVRVSDGRVYIQDGPAVKVIDVTDPSAPKRFLPSPPTISGLQDIAVLGRTVYAACGDGGLKILDFTDPRAPVLAARLPLPGNSRLCEVIGDTAFVGTSSALHLVHLGGTGATPTLIGSVALAHEPREVHRAGDLLLVLASDHALIIDIADPQVPTLESTIYMMSVSSGAIIGHHILLALAYPTDNLRIWDITDPAHPVAAPRQSIPCEPFKCYRVGNLLHVSGRDAVVTTVDVSQPATPRTLRGRLLPSRYSQIWDLVADSRQIYVVTSDRFGILGLDGPDAPLNVGHYPTSQEGYSVAQRGELAVVGDRINNLAFFDLADPHAPRLIASLTVPGRPLDMTIEDQRLYIAAAFNGLEIIDIVDPASPALISSLRFSSPARAVAVSGNVASVALTTGELCFVDVSDPAAPTLRSVMDLPWPAVRLGWHGDLALVADGPQGLLVVDVSNLTQPVEVGWANTPGYAADVASGPGVAYVADQIGGLIAVDLDDPESHLVQTAVGGSVEAEHVARVGNVLYVAGQNVLQVFDLSDWREPRPLGTVYTHVVPRRLAASASGVSIGSVEGLSLFSAQCGSESVAAFLQDLQVQPDPLGIEVQWRTSEDLPATAFRIAARSADAPAIARWYPAIRRTAPGTFAARDQDGARHAGRLSYELLADFAGDGRWLTLGEVSISVTPAAPQARVAATPNPFNPRTTLSFDVPTAGHATLAIHDLRGRRLAMLAEGSFPAGAHTVVWHGITDRGEPLPAGTYLARLTTEAGIATRKLSLVR